MDVEYLLKNPNLTVCDAMKLAIMFLSGGKSIR
jgi:hypothetical protein